MLNQEQIETFHREGWLVVEDLLTDADLQPVIDQLNEEIDCRARQLVASGELSRAYEEEGFETRLRRITDETDKIYWAIDSGRLAGPGIFRLLTNPKLVAVAESLVGPEIIASSVYRLRIKMPVYWHGNVPWHQDSGYFEPYCDQSLILTVWIPFVDATPERGCLQVMPRAHKGDVYRHSLHAGHRKYLEILPEDLPPGEVLDVPVRKGGILLMTNRTPHQSTVNRSEVIRWSMDLRYQAAALPTNYRTQAGEPFRPAQEDSEPLACYPPEADFLVRSRRRPEDVVTDWHRFREIRQQHEKVPVTSRWE